MRVRCSEIACGLVRSVHRADRRLVQSSCPVLGQGLEDRRHGRPLHFFDAPQICKVHGAGVSVPHLAFDVRKDEEGSSLIIDF